MKSVKVLSLFLGLMSLAFGLLKFINPFKTWYAEQIATSGLPQDAYALGITGEILIGITFLFPFIVIVTDKLKRLLLIFANISLFIMMMSATIVHIVPNVPASVLPLKIKPPVIPLLFLCTAVFNLVKITKMRRI